jgi:CheY-like chemotaxis protein
MPGMDGFEAARRIIGIRPELPVIGLSAHVVAEECRACVAAGMVGYLTKPLDLDALVRQFDALSSTPSRLRCDEASRARDAAKPSARPEAVGATRASIDWDALHARFAASPGFVERLVRTAMRSESGAPDELRALAAAGDLDGYFRKAHAVKGLAGNLCANPLLLLATKACRLAREGDATAFEQAEPLAAALESLLSELSRRLDAPS